MGLLVDGQTTCFALQALGLGALVLVEKTLTPSGADGRGGIDMTSLRNSRRTTMAPKQLVTFTPMKVTAYYDPAIILAYNGALQFNQGIFQRFSDGSYVLDYGWLDKFQPHEHKEGEDCLADCEFVFSGVPNIGQQATLAQASAFAPGNERLPTYTPPFITVAAFLALSGGALGGH